MMDFLRTILKIIIVLGFSFAIGYGLIHYTHRGQQHYQQMKSDFRNFVLSQMNIDQTMIVETGSNTDTLHQDVLIFSGTAATRSDQVDGKVLQERLLYYQEHKGEIRGNQE